MSFEIEMEQLDPELSLIGWQCWPYCSRVR